MKWTLFFVLTTALFLKGAAQLSPSMLRTIPTGAEVFDEKRNKLGETPFDLNILKEDYQKISVEKEGYDSVVIYVSARPKKGGFWFPVTTFSCAPCAMVYDSTGPYEPVRGTLRMRKKLPDYDRQLMVAIDTPRFDMPNYATIGILNGSKKFFNEPSMPSIIGYVWNMQKPLTVKNSYLDPYSISYLDKDGTTLYQPKIIFKPLIKDINFNFTGKSPRDYAGACRIKCIWNISLVSDSDKNLAQFPIETFIYRSKYADDSVLNQLIGESQRDLLGIDTLYSFLSRIEKEYLSKTKGEILEIKPPPFVSYTSTKDMLKGVGSSVVTVETQYGFGSGSIISQEGHIITSYHVLLGENNIYVTIGKGTKKKATIVKTNQDYDLALIKIDSIGLKALVFGNSDSTDIGDDVFAVGTPLEKSLQQSITRGIISGFRQFNGVSFIQTDVSINAGNSGGPLLNSKGEIIGISTFKASGRGIEGIGFGIPSNVIIEMLNIKFEK